MQKTVVVIGEHPANDSGFGKITHQISSALFNSHNWHKVICLGILPRITEVTSDFQYICLNSPQYGDNTTPDNVFGKVSLSKLLNQEKDITDIVCTGDIWYHEHIGILKSFYPNIKFHYYAPVEGEKYPPIMQSGQQTLTQNINSREYLKYFDNIIAYSETGMKAINALFKDPICNQYVYHWLDDKMIEDEPIPGLKEKLDGKFVIGFMGRNCVRKSIDQLLILIDEITKRPDHNIIFLLHIPKQDLFGYDIDSILEQCNPEARKSILFTEELLPNLYKGMNPQTGYTRDVKKGMSRGQLQTLYKSMNLFINLSRSEGFGLPLIEAMSYGVPTLVNGYSTPKEIMIRAGTQECSLEPSSYEYLGSGNNAYVALANIKEFKAKILYFMRYPEKLSSIASKQRNLVDSDCSIKNATTLAESIINFNKGEKKAPKISIITSYMPQCGIKTYTTNMMEHLHQPVNLLGVQNLKSLNNILTSISDRVFHMQHEANLWPIEQVIETFQAIKKTPSNKLVVTIHTYNEEMIKRMIPFVDMFIFHRDTPEIQALNIKYTIISHPIPYYKDTRSEMRAKFGIKDTDTVLSLNGFSLPYKRLYEQSAEVLKFMVDHENYRLLVVASPHSSDRSGVGRNIIESIVRNAQALKVQSRTHIIYGFLKKEEMGQFLNISDYGLCYHNAPTVGAQSGSVRELLGARVVPIVTYFTKQKTMHDEIIDADCAIGLATDGDISPVDFAKGACKLISENPIDKTRLISNIDKYNLENSFERAAKVHLDLYNTI